MINQEYIRAAVELADRWAIYMPGQFVNSNEGLAVESPCGYMGVLDATPELLDALAAQLVRQVDSTEQEIEFDSPEVHGQSSVRIWCPSKGYITDGVEGPDRTMNTIKVIVDSKVLK